MVDTHRFPPYQFRKMNARNTGRYKSWRRSSGNAVSSHWFAFVSVFSLNTVQETLVRVYLYRSQLRQKGRTIPVRILQSLTQGSYKVYDLSVYLPLSMCLTSIYYMCCTLLSTLLSSLQMDTPPT